MLLKGEFKQALHIASIYMALAKMNEMGRGNE
jgi:hypothetical protein